MLNNVPRATRVVGLVRLQKCPAVILTLTATMSGRMPRVAKVSPQRVMQLYTFLLTSNTTRLAAGQE